MKNMKKGLFANKKFKYGSIAAGLTAAVIVFAVLVNLAFTALCQKYSWYVDMTPERLYGVSETSVALLTPLESTDTQIRIIFLQDRDRVTESYYSNLVYQCAMNFSQQFDFVTVDFIDMEAHPQQVDRYRTTAATQLGKQNVIIENGSDFRVFQLQAFFYSDSQTNELIAMNAEYKITSTILQMTAKSTPIAYFTVGHGETTESSSLWKLFSEAGYDVRTIDLSKETLDPDAKVMIINGPKYDFIGAYEANGALTEVNEMDKVDDFMDGQGNVMLFMDPTAAAEQDFRNLRELLADWGIALGDTVIRDTSNSVSVDGYSLVAQYETEGLGASITKPMRELETIPKTIVHYAMPINTLWETMSIDQSVRKVSTILKSYSTSEALSLSTAESRGTGEFDLMVFSQDSIYIDNEPHYTYLTVCGTSDFCAEEFLSSNAFGNADVLYAIMKVMGKEVVPADIDLRLFEDKSLVVTNTQARVWTVCLTAVLPAAVIAVGAVVYVRRKRYDENEK